MARIDLQNRTIDGFFETLVRSYDELTDRGEVSIEDVYRKMIVLTQRPALWRTGDSRQFTSFSKPMFRAGVSKIVSSGLRTKDGRSLKFGTSLSAKDKWEFFFEAEDRVVQLGRLYMSPGEEQA